MRPLEMKILKSGSKGRLRAPGEGTERRILGMVGVLLAAAGAAATPARAQEINAPAAPAAPTAPAQVEEQRALRTGGWHVTPQISVSETYSDNVAHVPSASAQSGWMRSVAPGIRIDGAGARVKGFFDYRLFNIVYANQSQLNNNRNLLNSSATIEAVEDWLFVDARAIISQQYRSAIGAVANDTVSANSNRVETTTYQVSPYIRGRMSDIAAYRLRYNATSGGSKDGAIPNTNTSEWAGRIKSAPSSAKLGWSVDGSALNVRNSTVGNRQDARISGSLIYDIDPQLHVSIIYGHETTDYASSTKQAFATPGFGFEWSPSQRTQVSAVKEKRFFGDGHSLIFSHRTPLVAWKYTDSKDVSVMPNQIAASGLGTISGLMSDLLARSNPDPVARAQAVNARLEQTGVSALTTASGGVLTSSIFVTGSRVASVVLLGAINTVTLSLTQTDRQSIGLDTGTVNTFSSNSSFRQQGWNVAWAHRLTPLSTMTLMLSRLRTEALTVTSSESSQNIQNLIFSTQLSPRTFASVAARRTQFDNSVGGGFRENALVGTLTMRF